LIADDPTVNSRIQTVGPTTENSRVRKSSLHVTCQWNAKGQRTSL